MSEFTAFPKIPRLNRPIVITEKIDGTNAAVGIPDNDDDLIWAQSRKRIITPEADNFGFARWAYDNSAYLAQILGPGLHFGEWYGRGIQRNYGITDPAVGADGKFFALFNVGRWQDEDLSAVPGLTTVPVLGEYSTFDTNAVREELELLRLVGSDATGAVGYKNPEGVVVFHKQGNVLFKATLENDEQPKGQH